MKTVGQRALVAEVAFSPESEGPRSAAKASDYHGLSLDVLGLRLLAMLVAGTGVALVTTAAPTYWKAIAMWAGLGVTWAIGQTMTARPRRARRTTTQT